VQPVWLELADYDPWPDYFEPGHRCLRGSEAVLAVNLHCYAANAVEVERYLRLRDRLRGHEHDRLLYETTKRCLAGRQWPDMEAPAG